MGPTQGDGDAGDIEGVSHGILEGFDAALAEDDAAIALAEDVFGGEEPILDGRGQAALEEDGLAHFSDLAKEIEILHVAGANLETIDVFFHLLDLAGVHDFDADGHAEFVAAFAHPLEAGNSESLEGIWAGS